MVTELREPTAFGDIALPVQHSARNSATSAPEASDHVRSVDAWHNIPEYQQPSGFTLHEPGDAAIEFPQYWPSCGCAIAESQLELAEKRARKTGRRFSRWALMDRPYFNHCYQAHGIYREDENRPPRPARRELAGELVRRMAVTEEGARAAGFPEKTLHASYQWVWENWPHDIAGQFILAVRGMAGLNRRGYGFLIHGNTGTGKTCALALIAEAEIAADGLHGWQYSQGEWRRSGHARVRYLTFSQLESMLATGRYEDRGKLLAELRAVDHLFLDEYGVQSHDEKFDAVVFELLKGRWGANRPTHIASNCHFEETFNTEKNPRLLRLWDFLQAFPRFTLATSSARDKTGAWREAVAEELPAEVQGRLVE